MSKVFVPNFRTAPVSVFSTMNPTQADRISNPVFIVNLEYNQATNTIIAEGSDNRKRRCQLNRITADGYAEKLCNALQRAYDYQFEVQFIAAGGNDPGVWFYNIQETRG
jgi:hypothetical protein